MSSLSAYPKFKGRSADGVALANGLLYTYEAGTSTLKDTYSDSALSASNTNPVVLDSNGEAVVFLNGMYKLILKDSNGVLQWTIDNVKDPPTDAVFEVDHNSDGTHEKLTVGADVDGDMYYRSSSALTRLAKGTALQNLSMNSGATIPEWTVASTPSVLTTQGDMLYAALVTNLPTRRAKGTEGKILKMNAAFPYWYTAPNAVTEWNPRIRNWSGDYVTLDSDYTSGYYTIDRNSEISEPTSVVTCSARMKVDALGSVGSDDLYFTLPFAVKTYSPIGAAFVAGVDFSPYAFVTMYAVGADTDRAIMVASSSDNQYPWTIQGNNLSVDDVIWYTISYFTTSYA